MTDEELVAQARQGDTHAFGELVARHQSAVVRTALVVCRCQEDAEDVAQEAFVVAWRRLGGFRGEARFKTWLLTIAWRQALTRRRSRWQRLFRAERPDDRAAFDLPAAGPDPEQALAGARRLARVRALVGALPDTLRDPLLLAAGRECTFDEMAAILGVPSGTLKWRVMEARKRLKRELAERERA